MPWTREQRNQYRRDYYRRTRSAYFADKVCWWCGTDEDLRLRYDGEDGLDLSNIWCWAKQDREMLLDRCRVMCRPCWHKSWRPNRHFQKQTTVLLHKQWMRNHRRYRWILRQQGIRIPVATPSEEYVKMVLETIATL